MGGALKTVTRIAAPVVGAFLGGPLGAGIGGALSGAFSKGNILKNTIIGGLSGYGGAWAGSKLGGLLGSQLGKIGASAAIQTGTQTFCKYAGAALGGLMFNNYQTRIRDMKAKQQQALAEQAQFVASDFLMPQEKTRKAYEQIDAMRNTAKDMYHNTLKRETGIGDMSVVDKALENDRIKQMEEWIKHTYEDTNTPRPQIDPNEDIQLNPVETTVVDQFVNRRRNRTKRREINRYNKQYFIPLKERINRFNSPHYASIANLTINNG